MLEIELGKSDKESLELLEKALETLSQRFDTTDKFNYSKRYDVLLQNEKEWSKFEDPDTGEKVDMSISMPDWDESDEQVRDVLRRCPIQIQKRRDYISREAIRASKSHSRIKRLYKQAKALMDEFEAFWRAIPEIRAMRSKDLREAEIFLRMKNIIGLYEKITVYFYEGKHKDHGQSIYYEAALKEALNNLDSKKEIISRQVSLIKMDDNR